MTRLILLATIFLMTSRIDAQEWDFIAHDSAQASVNFILETDNDKFYGLNNFGNQYSVVSYDANKNPLWSTQVTCVDDLWIRTFLEGPNGNLYVIGEFYQTCSFQTDTITGNYDFIAVYDPSGVEIELHLMPVSHKIRGAFFNGDGNLMLGTSFGSFGSNNYTLINGDTIYTHGAVDILFMEMDLSFTVLDTARISSPTADYIYSMKQRDGGYDVMTNFLDDLTYPGGSVIKNVDFDNVLFRVEDDLTIDEQFIIEYKSGGSSFGAQVMNDDGELFFLLQLSSWSMCYLSGDSLAGDGEYKNYLVKMADDGSYEWSKQLAAHQNSYASFPHLILANDSLYFTGYSNYNLSFDQGDHYAAKYKYSMFAGVADQSGNTQLLTTIDDTLSGGQSYIYGANLQNGHLYLCGSFLDTVNINGQSFNGTGYRGYFGRLDIGAEVITATEELADGYPIVYPIPASNQLHISSVETLNQIQLHDQSGRIVLNKGLSAMMTTIEVSNLSAGIYLLSVTDQKGNLSRKKIIVD